MIVGQQRKIPWPVNQTVFKAQDYYCQKEYMDKICKVFLQLELTMKPLAWKVIL